VRGGSDARGLCHRRRGLGRVRHGLPAGRGRARVTVIEHGGSDAGPFIQMPGALSYPMNMGIYDWGLKTEPEPHLGNRRACHPARQGDRRVVVDQRHGLCPRPCARLRHLGRDGGDGWAYADVLPYFKRMEQSHGGSGPNSGAPDGPLHITRGPRDNPLFDAFIEAGQQAGYPVTQDYNGQQQEGFGPFEATIWKGGAGRRRMPTSSPRWQGQRADRPRFRPPGGDGGHARRRRGNRGAGGRR
jgi:choline dehydrogenase-like flavoprotein